MKHTGGDVSFTMTGLGSVFVYDRMTQRAHEVPELIAAMLSRTGAMATLDEHARSLCQRLRMPASQLDAVRAHLAELAQAGLLVSERDLRAWAESNAAPEDAPGPIDTAAILTCEGADRARAALGSLADSLARHGRGCQVVLIDDSRDEDARARGRRAAAALAGTRGMAVAYAGLAERRRFADALVDAGVPRHAVDIALFDRHEHGVSPGVSRNALLLHTAGETCYAADDDTLSELAGPAEAAPVLALANRDPAGLWVFPDRADREAALAGAGLLGGDADLLACHELLLGKDPGTCLATLGQAAALLLDGMRPPFLRRLCHGGRVAVTVFGVAGDCGLDSNASYLLQEGAALARLVDGPEPYLVLRDSREVHRAAPRLTLTSHPAFAATAAAYDNRDLLPPFLSAGRGEDLVFGLTLRTCLTRDAIGHLPWAIRHQPAARARFAADDFWRGAVAFSMAQAVILAMGTLDLPAGAGEPEDRLRAVGAHLEQVARLSLADFEDLLQVERLRRLSGLIDVREQLLAEHADVSEEWAQDMEQSIEALREACSVDRLPVAADLGERLPEERAREALRVHLGEHGVLLQAWPEMMQAARALRAEGRTLARDAGEAE